MTWLTGNQYTLSFSTFPRICGIKDGWIIQLFLDNYSNLETKVFERKTKVKPYKILIKEKIENNKLKLVHINEIKIGDIIKLDKDIPLPIKFTLYYEVMNIDKDNNIITLNRDIIQEIDLDFIERSDHTGIYSFDFTPEKSGFYNFQISNPNHFIKPFGITIEVKDKFYIKEIISSYTKELNKKFNVKNFDPINKIDGVENPVWFNNLTGKVWVFDGSSWITADK